MLFLAATVGMMSGSPFFLFLLPMSSKSSIHQRIINSLLLLVLVIGAVGWMIAIDRMFLSNPQIPPARVWDVVETQAKQHDLDPGFVYSLVFAESSFHSRAVNTGGKGIMQVSRVAWEDTCDYPYDEQVWDWKTNIEVGVAYLAWCRDYLEAKNQFSYPLLAACYHQGPDEVRRKQFDMSRLGKTHNHVYAQLFQGNNEAVSRP